MEGSVANRELLSPQPPENGISHAKARMIAEGATWLATGETPARDESDSYGRLMNRLEAVVPPLGRYDWLIETNEALGGHRPIDFIDAGQLEPLQKLVDSMPGAEHSGNGAG